MKAIDWLCQRQDGRYRHLRESEFAELGFGSDDAVAELLRARLAQGGAVFVRALENDEVSWNRSEEIDLTRFENTREYSRGIQISLVTVATMSRSRADASSDVSNLAYHFLDMIDTRLRAGAKGRSVRSVLIVRLAGDGRIAGSGFDDDEFLPYRVQAALALLVAMVSDQRLSVQVYTNGSLVSVKGLPLRGDGSVGWSAVEGEGDSDNLRYYRVVPVIPIAASSGSVFGSKCSSLRDLQSSEHAYDSDEIDSLFDDDKAKLQTSGSAKRKAELLRILTGQMARDLANRVQGTVQGGMSKDDKEKLVSAVREVMNEHLDSSSILAQFLYLYAVTAAVLQKDLLGLAHSDSGDIARLRGIAFDALSCAEGAFQLIENSCIHTSAGIAFLSLSCRNFSSSKSGLATSDEAKASLGRRMLELRYGNNAERVPLSRGYWIELRVMDVPGAKTPSGRIVRGLPETFSATHEEEAGKVRDVSGLIRVQGRPGKLGDVMTHYGIRMLLKIVAANRGSARVLTPVPADAERGYALTSWTYCVRSDGKERLRETKLDKGRFTEFSVILPALRPDKGRAGDVRLLGERGLYDARGLGLRFTPKYSALWFERAYDNRLEMRGEGDVLDSCNQRVQLLDTDFDGDIASMKASAASHAADAIRPYFRPSPSSDRPIHLIECRSTGLADIELFAKALYGSLHVYRKESDANAPTDDPLHIAVILPRKSDVYHFLRVSSVFYAKRVRGDLYRRHDFRLYVCCPSEESFSDKDREVVFPEVCFVLASGSVECAQKTAEIFCYYHAAATLDMTQFIGYLCRSSSLGDASESAEGSAALPAIIPVDAYLMGGFVRDGKKLRFNSTAISDGSWLIRRLGTVVNRDAGHGKAGCRHSDVHVHIGTKVHIPYFFQCTAVFQNVALNNKLAFVLASDMLKSPSLNLKMREQGSLSDLKVYVYGYEGYSSLLVREVASLLTTYCRGFGMERDARTLIYSNNGERVSGVEPLLDDLLADGEGVAIFPVLPIATTCSTLYKMLDRLRACLVEGHIMAFPEMKMFLSTDASREHGLVVARRANEVLSVVDSIEPTFQTPSVIVLVGPKGEDGGVRKKYWSPLGPEATADYGGTGVISVRRPSAGDEVVRHSGLVARWYVKARVEWSDSFDGGCQYCTGESCLNERVLLSADRTGTVAKVSFAQLADASSGGEGVVQADGGKKGTGGTDVDPDYSLLFGSVEYGHLWDGNNHSQFFIDVPRLYANIDRKRDGYENWLALQRKALDRGTYNVLIAPIEPSESGFYSDIINRIFESSIRVVHTNLAESGVDDIRSRYSSVVQDLASLASRGRGGDIRLYYAQACLRSGRSLRKAEAVVRMFCKEAGIESLAPTFRKVFCLVDQSVEYISSARETTGFITLNAPSLGIKSASCPICESVERLRLAANRCADGEAASRLLLAAKRMRRKSPREEREWRAAEIMESDSYLEWLHDWVKDGGGDACPLFAWHVVDGQDEKRIRETISWIAERSGSGYSSIRELDELFEDDCERRGKNGRLPKPSEIVFEYIIPQRNLMRLVCEDELGKLFGIDSPKSAHYLTAHSERRLIRYAVELIFKRIQCRMEEAPTDYLKKEWLVSYLKTISRGRMLLVHHIRQAALTITLCFVDALVNRGVDYRKCDYLTEPASESLNSIVGLIKCMRRAPRLRIDMVLVGRLADLGSTYLLRRETVGPLIRLIADDMSDKPENDRFQTAIEIVRMAMIRCMVLCEDGSKVELAWKLRQELQGGRGIPGISDAEGSETRGWIAYTINRTIDLGVTPVLFSGIERLWREWNTVPVRESLLALSLECIRCGIRYDHDDGRLRNAKARAIREVFIDGLEPLIEERKLATDDATNRSSDEWSDLAEAAAFIDNNRHHFYSDCAKRMVRSAWDAAHIRSGGSSQLLAMNQLSRFFEFAVKMVVRDEDPEREDRLLEHLADMLLLFKYVMDLADKAHVKIPRSSRPEVYEGICTCIGDLLDADGCVMVYAEQGEPRIIFGGLIKGEILSSDDGEGDRARKGSREKGPRGTSDRGLQPDQGAWGAEQSIEARTVHEIKQYIGDGTLESHAITIALRGDEGAPGGAGVRDRKVCFVPVKRQADKLEELEACQLRRVLFLRSALQEILERDLVQLLQDASDYSSVRRFTSCAKSYSVLHLTDLHLSRGDSRATDQLRKLMYKNVAERAREIWHEDDRLFDRNYDLIAISGDIAQASRSGGGQRENYRYAAKFIFSLARYLWSDKYGRVSWNWFKRVMVVSGNHDYTSSSGFESMTISYRRTSEMAKPSRTSTETPAQFIYFYDFLHNALRADLGALWTNKLNEVRNYDRLGISFVMLNSSARVGPLRTNKVGLAPELSDFNLVESLNSENRVVVLTHHSPTYCVDYVADEYLTPEFMDPGGRRMGFRLLSNSLLGYPGINTPLSWSEIHCPKVGEISDLSDEWLQENMNARHKSGEETGSRKLEAEAEKSLDECNSLRERSSLARSVNQANADARDGEIANEGVMDTVALIKRFNQMSDHDAREYQKALNELCQQIAEKRRRANGSDRRMSVLYLCGHTHAGARDSINWEISPGPDPMVLEADARVLGRFSEGLWCACSPEERDLEQAEADGKVLSGFLGSVVRENIDNALEQKTNIFRVSAFRYGELLAREGDNPELYRWRGVLAREETLLPHEIDVVPEDECLCKTSGDRHRWLYRSELWKLLRPGEGTADIRAIEAHCNSQGMGFMGHEAPAESDSGVANSSGDDQRKGQLTLWPDLEPDFGGE